MSIKWLIIATALVCCYGPVHIADEPIRSPYPMVPSKSGEHCTVCDVQLGADDVALIIKGRRVPLERHMVGEFLKNQEKYLSSKLVKTALFQEEFQAPAGVAQGGISMAWFLLGLYVLCSLLFAGLSGYAAVAKGLPARRSFFLGLLLTVPGYLYVVTRPSRAAKGEIPRGLTKVPATHAPLACPNCGNTNHPAAAHCSRCHSSLTPKLESETART
jgi:hypothetical protein